MSLFSFFKGKQEQGAPGNYGNADRGIMVFENTSEVIQAENILKKILNLYNLLTCANV